VQAALKRDFVSVDDYFAGEEASQLKHEYISGSLYAMAGVTTSHNLISGNIYASIKQALRGGLCRVFIADVKVRLNIAGEDIFYYPDVMVGCDPRDTHRLYLRYPNILVEVSSESTERLDRGEKRLAYQTIETLEEYVIAAQERVEVTIFRRASNWKPEVLSRMSDTVNLKSISLSLKLSSIYEGIVTGAAR